MSEDEGNAENIDRKENKGSSGEESFMLDMDQSGPSES